VYGLGADASNPDAVRKIFELKGRPATHPLIVHIDNVRALERWALNVPPAAAALAEKFWPGPLTLVLRGGEGRVPARLRGPEGGVAVRFTPHAGLQRLLQAYGEPITSTSANRPGVPPAMMASEIVQQWPDEIRRGVLRVLDSGRLEPSKPSTVVDCTGRRARVIRPGVLSAQQLREVVPDLVGDT